MKYNENSDSEQVRKKRRELCGDEKELMAIQTFDNLQMLAEHFDSVVYSDSLSDSLLVEDTRNNVWHRYTWTPGQREIKFRETVVGGELPILVQVYPKL